MKRYIVLAILGIASAWYAPYVLAMNDKKAQEKTNEKSSNETVHVPSREPVAYGATASTTSAPYDLATTYGYIKDLKNEYKEPFAERDYLMITQYRHNIEDSMENNSVNRKKIFDLYELIKAPGLMHDRELDRTVDALYNQGYIATQQMQKALDSHDMKATAEAELIAVKTWNKIRTLIGDDAEPPFSRTLILLGERKAEAKKKIQASQSAAAQNS